MPIKIRIYPSKIGMLVYKITNKNLTFHSKTKRPYPHISSTQEDKLKSDSNK